MTEQTKAPMTYKNRTILIDNDKNTKLHYAAAFDDVVTLEKEILNGQNVNAKNFFGWTPLMVAVRSGSKAAINFLLSKGANSTEHNYYGMNLLLMAICGGDLDIVKTILNYLLNGGVSRRILQKFVSPLSIAILFGHNEVFQLLIKKNFEIDVATPLTGITPLMFAAALSNSEMFNELLSKNANRQFKNAINSTAQDIIDLKVARATPKIIPKLAQPVPPIVLISPNNEVQSFNLPYIQYAVRRSSGVPIICSPCITPITPLTPMIPLSGQPYGHQAFFPPNFTPSNFSPFYYHSNEFLNMNVSQLTPNSLSPFQ